MAHKCQMRVGKYPAQAKGKGGCLTRVGIPPRPKKRRARVTFGITETTMFRVDKTMTRFGLKKSLKKEPARLPSWNEREWSAAQAARRVAELAYLVSGSATGDVTFWDGKDV